MRSCGHHPEERVHEAAAEAVERGAMDSGSVAARLEHALSGSRRCAARPCGLSRSRLGSRATRPGRGPSEPSWSSSRRAETRTRSATGAMSSVCVAQAAASLVESLRLRGRSTIISSASGAIADSACPMDSGGIGVPSGRAQVSRDSPEPSAAPSERWRPGDRSSARMVSRPPPSGSASTRTTARPLCRALRASPAARVDAPAPPQPPNTATQGAEPRRVGLGDMVTDPLVDGAADALRIRMITIGYRGRVAPARLGKSVDKPVLSLWTTAGPAGMKVPWCPPAGEIFPSSARKAERRAGQGGGRTENEERGTETEERRRRRQVGRRWRHVGRK